MTADIFAIWKFKNIEGLIECNGYDFQTTKIKKGLDTYFIKYNLKTEEATIEKLDNLFLPDTVPFSKLREELVKMYLWQARKEVHSSVLSKLDETI
mgnify:CR=1 FL=1